MHLRRLIDSTTTLPTSALRTLVAALLVASTLFAGPSAAQVDDPADPTSAGSDALVPADQLEAEEPLFENRDDISSSAIRFTGTANSANARWLVDLYGEAFGRDPDLGGLDHWLARIAAGGERSRTAVVRSFLNSVEGSRGEAIRAYADVLDRAPDAGGLDYWTNFLRTNPVTVLRMAHLSSDEFYERAGGTNADFVRAVYQEVLFRDPDAGGLDFYVRILDGGRNRYWVSHTIYRSDESMQNRVRAYYREILDRAPTSAELTRGAALIRNDDERAVRAALLGSDEAFEAFYDAATD